jgi:hypothetical protein
MEHEYTTTRAREEYTRHDDINHLSGVLGWLVGMCAVIVLCYATTSNYQKRGGLPFKFFCLFNSPPPGPVLSKCLPYAGSTLKVYQKKLRPKDAKSSKFPVCVEKKNKERHAASFRFRGPRGYCRCCVVSKKNHSGWFFDYSWLAVFHIYRRCGNRSGWLFLQERSAPKC